MELTLEQKKIIIQNFHNDYNRKNTTQGNGKPNTIESIPNLPPFYKLEGFESAPPIVFLDVENNNDYIVIKASLEDQDNKNMINNTYRQAYNLSCSWNYNYPDIDNKIPNFIDIPKNTGFHNNRQLLITPMLDGESIIFTELDNDNYRVFYDRRPNSSVLYDNVVYSFDAIDYRYDYNSFLKKFTPKQKGNIFLSGCFSHNDKEWKLSVYSDINQKNKTNQYKLKETTNHQKNTINKINTLKKQLLNELKDNSNEFNLTIPNTSVEQWSYENIKELSNQYHKLKEERINTLNISIVAKDIQYLANNDFLYEIEACNEITRLFDIKEKNGSNSVITIVDNIEAVPFKRDTENQHKHYKNLVNYYFNTGNRDFVAGYIIGDEQIIREYGNKPKFELYKELQKLDIGNETKGKLIRAIHLKTREMLHNFPIGSINNQINNNPNFSNSIDFSQTDFSINIQLNHGISNYGVCFSLSLLYCMSIETDAENSFISLLKNPKNMTPQDELFINKFIEKIQFAQSKSLFNLEKKFFNVSEIKNKFNNNTIKNISLGNGKHRTSLIKIFDSNDKFSHYKFFDPNYGVTKSNSIEEIFNLIEKIFPPITEKVNKSKYSVTEISSQNLTNQNKIKDIYLEHTSIQQLLTNIKENKPLAVGSIVSMGSLILNQRSSRMSSFVNIITPRFLHSSTSNLPLLGSIKQLGSGSGSTYSIDSVVRDETTGVESIQNKTIIAQEYRAFKYLNDQIKELRAAGIRWDNIQGKFVAWDNALGKFIGVDTVNSFNDKSGKVFAFMGLMQFISNKIAGEALVDESKAELRDFIIAQVVIDLSATAVDTGTELVAPSVRYIKHAITGTGIKSFLNSFGMNGANFLKYANIGFGGLGVALSIASLGLSIKMLTHIDPNKDPHGFKIAVVNTTFAAIGTVLSTAAFVCSMTGLVAFAALFGAIGIIVGLIGMITVGIMSLAKASAEGVQAVIDFFKSIDQYANKPIFENKNGVLIPAGLPITSIDYNTGEIVLGKYNAYSVEGRKISDIDKNNPSAEIIRGFNIIQSQNFDTIKNQNTLILPATPNLDIYYSYEQTPTMPNAEDIAIGQKLDTEFFKYIHNTNATYIVGKLIPEIQDTNINITLASENKVIAIPALSKAEGMITYEKVTTTITPSDEHKELHLFVGIGADLTILPNSNSAQKIKYTFNVYTSQQTMISSNFEPYSNGLVNTLTKEGNTYTINKYTTITLNPNSLKNNSFYIKDRYEEYSYNVTNNTKTYSILDAMNLKNHKFDNILDIIPVISKLSTEEQVLVKRIGNNQNDNITHGLYIKKLNKLFAVKDTECLTELKISNKVSGVYYLEQNNIAYFYSYSKSLVWSVDENGNLKHIFSLANLNTTRHDFYSPSTNNYQLSSVTPVQNGVIAKYTKNATDDNSTCRELTILCSENGMNLIQYRVIDRSKLINADISSLFTSLSKKGTPLSIPKSKLDEFINDYKNEITDSLRLDVNNHSNTPLKFNNSTTGNIKFSNLFKDYSITIQNSQISSLETEKSLGGYNVIENDTQNRKVFFSVVDTKDVQDIIKPLCTETSVTLLGESNGIYYFYSKKEDGKVYIQKGSGSKDSDKLLDTISTNNCKGIRLLGDDLILTNTENSIFSYNYREKLYKVLVANNPAISNNKIPTRIQLQNMFDPRPNGNIKLSDLVRLNSVAINNNPDMKLYSYLSTYVVLHENYEILHIAKDKDNDNIRYIWYVSKDDTGKNRLFRIFADLNKTQYNEANFLKPMIPICEHINDDYNSSGFKVGNNVYNFTNSEQGVELVNFVERDDLFMKTGINRPYIIPGYKKDNNNMIKLNYFSTNSQHLIPVTGNQNLKLIGKVNEDIFFLNKTDNKIMVAKADNNNPANNYKNIIPRENDNNLFDNIIQSNNDVIYSLKNGLNNHTLKLNNSYIEDCNSAYLTNLSGSLKVTFEQQFMNQINSCSIDDSNLEKLDLQFPDINEIIISIKGNTIVLHDSLSDFKLVFNDILLSTKVSLLNNITMHYTTKDNRVATKKLKDIIIKANNNTLPKDVQDIIISTMEDCIK